jgi:hypothetical protein
MPVTNCGQTTVLTGQDGMITMKPPGTLACLKDFTDFPAGTAITVPANSDFRVDDPVTFTEKGTANLVSALTPGTVYYIKARPTATTVEVSATVGGTAITITADGGTGTADTAGAGNHIEMSFASAFAMCEVPSVTLTVTRGEIDKTSIPCTPTSGTAGPKMARFRSYQSGFADGSGTLTLRLVEDLTAFNNRIIQGSLFNDQSGAILKAYFNAVAATGGTTVDDAASLYSEFPVILLGFDTGISQEETPTEVSVNFRISAQPTHLFGLTT